MIKQKNAVHEDFSAHLSVREVLSDSYETFAEAPFVFIGLSLMAAVIPMLAELVFGSSIIAGGGLICFALICQGTIVFMALQCMIGEEPSLAESLRLINTRVGAMFLLVMLIMFISVPGFVLYYLLKPFGFIAILVMGIFMGFVACTFLISVHICVVEKKGAMASLRRSLELTRGDRLSILILYMLTMLTSLVPAQIVSLISTVVAGPNSAGFAATLFIALPAAFFYVMTSIIYYKLRDNKEDLSFETMARMLK